MTRVFAVFRSMTLRCCFTNRSSNFTFRGRRSARNVWKNIPERKIRFFSALSSPAPPSLPPALSSFCRSDKSALPQALIRVGGVQRVKGDVEKKSRNWGDRGWSKIRLHQTPPGSSSSSLKPCKLQGGAAMGQTCLSITLRSVEFGGQHLKLIVVLFPDLFWLRGTARHPADRRHSHQSRKQDSSVQAIFVSSSIAPWPISEAQDIVGTFGGEQGSWAP